MVGEAAQSQKQAGAVDFLLKVKPDNPIWSLFSSKEHTSVILLMNLPLSDGFKQAETAGGEPVSLEDLNVVGPSSDKSNLNGVLSGDNL